MTPEEIQKLDEECRKIMGFSGANPSYVPPGPSNPPPPVIVLDDRTPPPRNSRRTREVSNNNEHFSKNLDRFLKRSREISSSSRDFSQDLDIHCKKRMAEKRMDEERKARKNRYGLAKKMLEESDDSHTTVRHYDRNNKSRSRSRSRSRKSRTRKRKSRSKSRSISQTRKRKSRSRSRSRSKRSRSKSQREPKLHFPWKAHHNYEIDWKDHHNNEIDRTKSPPSKTAIPILRNIGPSSYNPQLESARYLPKSKPPPKASKGPPMVSRISSKTKPKENNNPNPNVSPPSPTFEPVFPKVQDSGFRAVQEEEEEENIIDNLLLKKFKKSNGQEINMLTTWYNEALDVKVFRCFICNREVCGTQDLLTHLKGSRHQEYMKKIENLEITNSNEDNETSQMVSMIKSKTGNCHICSAKVKEKKLKEHIKNCEKIETKGFVLKSRKQCQLCDKVFKTLPEAFYHVKTGHFQIKEEKIQTEKEPDHIDYSIEIEYKLVSITDVENFKPNYGVLWDLYTLPMVLKDPRLGKYQETTEYKKKMDAKGWVIQ